MITAADILIINLRGTGGSGKSTVVRRIMDRCNMKTPTFMPGRRQPIGYKLAWSMEHPSLWVPGHYETPCGGCDTITSVDDVFESVTEHAANTEHVVFEGIISQDDTTRTIQLSRRFPLLVIFLTTPLAECLSGIQARRDERGDVRPLNPKNTASRMKRCDTHYSKLRDANVQCMKLDREVAFQECVKRLKL